MPPTRSLIERRAIVAAAVVAVLGLIGLSRATQAPVFVGQRRVRVVV